MTEFIWTILEAIFITGIVLLMIFCGVKGCSEYTDGCRDKFLAENGFAHYECNSTNGRVWLVIHTNIVEVKKQ